MVNIRVWIINQNAYSPSSSAGTRHFELARSLIRRGHEVLIIATSFYHKERKEIRLNPDETWKIEVINGVTFNWLRTPPYSGNNVARFWNMLVFTGRVWREVGIKEQSRPDVIIGSSPHLFAAWAAERLSMRYRIPFVLEIRDLWPEALVDLGGIPAGHPIIQLMALLESYLYRRATRIISVLPKAADYMVAKGAKRKNIVWLPNGIAVDSLPRAKPVKNNSVFSLMYTGAHSLYAGLEIVLDAAKILQQEGWENRVKIRLIGDGTLKPKLKELAEKQKNRIISFEPPVPKSQVHSLLRKADAFIMIFKNAPIYKWGISPNKLFDYMAAMRPVIFSVSSPYNPIKESGAGISVKPGDSRALANGIIALAKKPIAERRAMGQQGRAYVKKHHDYEKLGRKLENILFEIMEN